MPISQVGALNTTALVIPGVYVQIVPPQTLALNGVPSNVLGQVGTASWGPIGSAQPGGNMADYARTFGPIMPRAYDMGTGAAIACQQGAAAFYWVRVADGTQTAASAAITAGGLDPFWAALAGAINGGNSPLRARSQFVVFSPMPAGGIVAARYTGTLGNLVSFTLAPGTQVGTAKAIIGVPGQAPEVFDNVPFGATAPTYATASATLAGGADGAAGVTSTMMLGTDGLARTGLYALRGTGCGIAELCDVTDSTTWTTQVAYGLSEGTYMVAAGPAGDTITNAIATKAAAGLDSFAMKLLHGDWVTWLDTANGLTRLVSPAHFAVGLYGNLSPEQSGLNKQIYAIAGTQKGGAYSAGELQPLFAAGIDVIANPSPGGSYFSLGLGHNTSSDATRRGDSYTRLTNYIAATLSAGMGGYVGRVINLATCREVATTERNFFQGMLGQDILARNGDNSLPYSVVCGYGPGTNNPQERTALGYLQCDARVTYQGIVEDLICNLEGGATVITIQGTGQIITSGIAA